MVNAKQVLELMLNGRDLEFDQASWMMQQFMEGVMTPSQMSAMLIALRMKKESVTEIAACASVMRQKATRIPYEHPKLIDTCGTGGDASGSFNISTTVALLLAGGGYKIAKHGNRSMTSQSGSADCLEALGVHLDLTPQQVADCIDQVNIGFLFAPALHSAMKHVMPVRKEIAVRTVFNVLGPLTNPAGAQYQSLGLFDTGLVGTIARVLKQLGSKSAYVFSGLSGLDEVCISSDTQVCYLKPNGELETFLFNPEDYGFQKAPLESIRGGTPLENAALARQILQGDIDDPRSDIVAINAGFAISAADACSLKEGFEKSRTLLRERVGLTAIDRLVEISHSFD